MPAIPLPKRAPAKIILTPSVVPPPAPPLHPKSKLHGSTHWKYERLMSVATLGVGAAPFIVGTGKPILDAALSGILVVHSHMGMQQVCLDYFHKRKWPILSKVLGVTLWTFSIGTTFGLYQFNTNDVGVTEGIRRVWVAAGSGSS